MFEYLFLSLVVVILLFLYLYFQSNETEGAPFFGRIGDFLQNQLTLHIMLEKWSDKYGRYFKTKVLGRTMHIVSDIEIIQQLLNQRPTNFRRIANLEPFAREVSAHGVFSAEGEDWARQRKLTSPSFTTIKVKTHYDAISLVCSRLLNKWKKQFQEANNQNIIIQHENAVINNSHVVGIEVDVLKDMMSFTLDIIAIIAFGYDLNSIEKYSDIMSALLNYLTYAHHRLTFPLPYWKFFHLPIDKKFFSSTPVVKQLVHQIIADYYNEKNNNNNDAAAAVAASHDGGDISKKDFQSIAREQGFIHSILKERENGDHQLSDDEIFGNVITLLLAGQDTTANTLSWSLYYLSRNHEIQENVFNEVDLFKSSSPPSSSSSSSFENWYLPEKNTVAEMKYTTNVIKEVLRLRGATPLLFLQSNSNDLILKNKSESIQFSPKTNEPIIIVARKITKDPSIFGENASLFDPDRWNSFDERANDNPLLRIASLLPFGGGPRTCPGRFLSFFESTLFLSLVCNNFIIRPIDADSPNFNPAIAKSEDPLVGEELAFTLSPSNLKLKFFPRQR